MQSPTAKSFRNPNTLMVQGCTSDAGKSVMVAGLGRLIHRAGLSVAPFKPQNMALNSAVTVDGGEIGRAQAVQAQACGVEPHTDMNPVLLKPSSDTGAQIIVQGHPINTMQAMEFHEFKKNALQAVLNSYERLNVTVDKLVVEGAGSPAEINLRENDIANMGFAEAIDCPVILIADIDRGGVFAHLVGTLELLSASEQARVVGFVINRFRGDIKLLEPGLEWLHEKTGKPVLGVIPFLQDFHLDAEDAIVASQISHNDHETPARLFNIVVPVLPRISNHTDFDALRAHPQVNLQFVSSNQPPPPADLIILPGSKSVRDDLETLLSSQWKDYLQTHLRYGGKIIGICGGYQMLGRVIKDPQSVESNKGSINGFGLLPVESTLQVHKTLTRVSAKICHHSLEAVDLKAYEIHCGTSEVELISEQPFAILSDGRLDGVISNDGLVLGTYLHGLFDIPDACNAILAWAGLSSDQAIDMDALRERQIERLADCLEQNLRSEFLADLKQLTAANSATQTASRAGLY